MVAFFGCAFYLINQFVKSESGYQSWRKRQLCEIEELYRETEELQQENKKQERLLEQDQQRVAEMLKERDVFLKKHHEEMQERKEEDCLLEEKWQALKDELARRQEEEKNFEKERFDLGGINRAQKKTRKKIAILQNKLNEAKKEQESLEKLKIERVRIDREVERVKDDERVFLEKLKRKEALKNV